MNSSITFTYSDVAAEAQPPTPARTQIPQWFRELDKVPITEADEFPLGTVKACSPFRDALCAGYMIRLPQAIRVMTEGHRVTFTWRTPKQGFTIETHAPGQVKGSAWPNPSVFKFTVPWAVKLPEGYSALFTHPLNRYDLPFLTCSGVVDSDNYNSPVNLPFVWTGPSGEVWLDAGLPIAQVIPFKREEWAHTIKRVDEPDLSRSAEVSFTSIDGYRRQFRGRKVYR